MDGLEATTIMDGGLEATTGGRGENVDTAGGKDATYYVYMIGEVLIALVAIFGNGLLAYVIVKRRALHTTTNWLTVSLAAADFLVGIIGIPCALVAFNGKPSDAYGCLLVNTVILMFTQISIFGLLVIAIERFVAIKFPYQYTAYCTPTFACLVIGIYWVLAILIGLVPVFGWNLIETYDEMYCVFTDIIDMEYMVYFNFFGCVLTPLLIIFLIYCYIFKVVRKQSHQIASLQVPEHVNTHAQTTPTHSHSNFKKELKAAKWFAVVIGFFAICWLPVHIINTLGIYDVSYPFEVLLLAILLSHLNSAVNPILYGYGNSKIMAALKRTLRIMPSASELENSLGLTRSDNPTVHPSASRSILVSNGYALHAAASPNGCTSKSPLNNSSSPVSARIGGSANVNRQECVDVRPGSAHVSGSVHDQPVSGYGKPVSMNGRTGSGHTKLVSLHDGPVSVHDAPGSAHDVPAPGHHGPLSGYDRPCSALDGHDIPTGSSFHVRKSESGNHTHGSVAVNHPVDDEEPLNATDVIFSEEVEMDKRMKAEREETDKWEEESEENYHKDRTSSTTNGYSNKALTCDENMPDKDNGKLASVNI